MRFQTKYLLCENMFWPPLGVFLLLKVLLWCFGNNGISFHKIKRILSVSFPAIEILLVKFYSKVFALFWRFLFEYLVLRLNISSSDLPGKGFIFSDSSVVMSNALLYFEIIQRWQIIQNVIYVYFISTS